MDITRIATLTEARIVCAGAQVAQPVRCGFASDLMSDVLRLDSDGLLLITGLCNLQTIRTAEMADVTYILFVRGKRVTDDMLELAHENGMTLLESDFSMYRAVGVLYSGGLEPLY